MKWIFWLSIAGALYSYFIYPMILLVFPKKTGFRAGSNDAVQQPCISLIITAHNEIQRIRDKLENSLRLDNSARQLEILVASDCSEDGTDELVLSYASKGVRLIRAAEHKGKEYAQGLAIEVARGDILMFSDVATQIPRDALHIVTKAFADPRVGAVSSEDRFLSEDGKVAGEGVYVRYEMWLRGLESRAAGLVGLSGSLFAARREVCRHWDSRVPSDFNTALNCRLAGYRAVSDPQLLGIYKDIKNPAGEYQRKVRTVIRGLQTLLHKPSVLNPLRFGMFAFQIWSHKILRWAVPWFMLLALISSLFLATSHWIYMLVLIMQVLFYVLVLSAQLFAGLRKRALIRICYYFVQANLAVAHATLMFAMGRRITQWKPSDR